MRQRSDVHQALLRGRPDDDDHGRRLAELLPRYELALDDAFVVDGAEAATRADRRCDAMAAAAPELLGMIAGRIGLDVRGYDAAGPVARGVLLSAAVPEELVIGCVARADRGVLVAATPPSRAAFPSDDLEPGLVKLVLGHFVVRRAAGATLLVRARVHADDPRAALGLRGLRGLQLGGVRAALHTWLSAPNRRDDEGAHRSYLAIRSLFQASRESRPPRSPGAA